MRVVPLKAKMNFIYLLLFLFLFLNVVWGSTEFKAHYWAPPNGRWQSAASGEMGKQNHIHLP